VVWISNTIKTTCQRDLVTHLLEGGHSVLLTTKHPKECASLEESLVQPLRESTENHKIWAHLESDLGDFFRGNEKDSSSDDDEKSQWRPWGVDVWLHTGTADEEHPIEALESVFGSKATIHIPFRGVPKILYLTDFGDVSGHSQLAHLLRHNINHQGHLVSSALVEPSSLWSRFLYHVWYRQNWLEAATGVLVRKGGEKRDQHPNVVGAYGLPLVIPSVETVEAWHKRIDECFPKPSSSSKL